MEDLTKTYVDDTESFIRKSLSEEQLAVSVYIDRKKVAEQYAMDARDLGNEELAKKFELVTKTLQDILEEEEVHIGQFRELLDQLNVSKDKEREGEDEAQQDAMGESFTSIAKRLSSYL